MPVTRAGCGAIACLIGSLGCAGYAAHGSQGAGAPSSTSGPASGGAGTTTGGNGAASGGTGTGTGGASSGVAGSGTTGGPLIDGGWVFCARPDGGATSGWTCQPGTYVCDLGHPGQCFQCQTDGDCADPDLPTYDPTRLHCDLDSGLSGYQNFCQQCLDDFDCTGDSAGPTCDLNPASSEPAIETLGFETCGLGSPCAPGRHLVDGGCVPSTCAFDQDCAGVVSTAQVPEPYCVDRACNACASGDCPIACSSSAQCGGFWPVCELSDAGSPADGGAADGGDAGEPPGTCGCDEDVQCGFGGLRCLSSPEATPRGSCAYPCGSPEIQQCAALDVKTPICDSSTGFCEPCASDLDCQTQGIQPLVGLFCRPDGVCGCKKSSDCPAGTACEGPFLVFDGGAPLGSCVVPPPRCLPTSCPYGFCDLTDDACVGQCFSDYDCSCSPSAVGPFCVLDAGSCLECRDDSDCVALGFVNPGKGHCIRNNICGCASDSDCVYDPEGQVCQNNPIDVRYGSCGCFEDSECPTNQSCYSGQCTTGCATDADCPSGAFCDPTSSCRPRCDQGHDCQAPDFVCDRDDAVGQNGKASGGAAAGVMWCYVCLNASDCGGGLGCGADSGYACSPCLTSSDCAPSGVCIAGACHATCDAGFCPPGQLCAVEDVAGNDVDTCVECASPLDCSNGQGCDSTTHTCATCQGPNWMGGPYDCPPGAICSNYWSWSNVAGVCLQNCDVLPCSPGQECATLPALTPDHQYCFGCIQDSDCADAGPGAWCDVSVNLTFSCQLPAAG